MTQLLQVSFPAAVAVLGWKQPDLIGVFHQRICAYGYGYGAGTDTGVSLPECL